MPCVTKGVVFGFMFGEPRARQVSESMQGVHVDQWIRALPSAGAKVVSHASRQEVGLYRPGDVGAQEALLLSKLQPLAPEGGSHLLRKAKPDGVRRVFDVLLDPLVLLGSAHRGGRQAGPGCVPGLLEVLRKQQRDSKTLAVQADRLNVKDGDQSFDPV